MGFRDRGRENRDAETLGIGLAVRFEIGGLEGICTLNPPADNGALCSLSYESEMACRAEAAGEGWWEVLVTLQLVTSDFVL
jgi:hypothetical protein